MNCPNPDCREPVPSHLRYCVVCGSDARVPNVRAAELDKEVNALNRRLNAAEQEAATKGYSLILDDFRRAVSGSTAVICRPLGVVSGLLSSDNTLFGTFYQGVTGDARLPEDNEWDQIRQAVDSLLFPYYYEQIRFGALSLSGAGVTAYGEYCVVL